ncbi:hypothetical protein E1286_21885 [Nonomuraea terrae]|uniref:Uncharacterized protein n=1 Tax=Nonomuraea terrae TaxID=2530383 RepID=A0A4R4YM76_9ACTN|nr:hypothetical protein E1286_21885 [Nonomuraea terrae]
MQDDAGGWVTYHNTDAWRGTPVVDGALWGMWQTGGGGTSPTYTACVPDRRRLRRRVRHRRDVAAELRRRHCRRPRVHVDAEQQHQQPVDDHGRATAAGPLGTVVEGRSARAWLTFPRRLTGAEGRSHRGAVSRWIWSGPAGPGARATSR